MKALVFGSINNDYTYKVDHLAQEGETITCTEHSTSAGGKGLNQSIALANAGVESHFAGSVGSDGSFLCDILKFTGVHEHIYVNKNAVTGHAIIQNDPKGNNCIVVCAGTNKLIPEEHVDNVLELFEQGDYLLCQNQINVNKKVIETAISKGMKVVLNPSPVRKSLFELPLDKIEYLILNCVEMVQICKHLGENTIRYAGRKLKENDAIKLCEKLHKHLPITKIILTLGDYGSVYYDKKQNYFCPAREVEAVDATGAGDTFTGYFVAGIMQGKSIEEAMKKASIASSITVTKVGAAQSIPTI